MILRCTRCSTEMLHRANVNCPVRHNLGRQKKNPITQREESPYSKNLMTIGYQATKAAWKMHNFICIYYNFE
ncbi:hypothetical protein TcasGA2_TC030984 [Tribolium castaneum]|uniref:Uncharacterized protein n=1 Tax=Tribolium castaneum TaxID=7070 RepID=A0A139WNL7_TRICA|nr:hypothetical protein TcasGA2_TC030984 [Tribolium castaneum]